MTKNIMLCTGKGCLIHNDCYRYFIGLTANKGNWETSWYKKPLGEIDCKMFWQVKDNMKDKK